LNPHVNVKGIVIGLMDRLSAYAARESEIRSPEERQKAEDEATTKLLEKLKISKAIEPLEESKDDQTDGETKQEKHTSGTVTGETVLETEATTEGSNAPKTNGEHKSRGIPDNVKLFEIFHEQVINLVNAQRLPIQDITALLGSLANLAL